MLTELNTLHSHSAWTSMLTCSPRATRLALQIAALHNDFHAILPARDEAHITDEVLGAVLAEGGVEHQG